VPHLCRAVGPSRRRSERKGLGAGALEGRGKIAAAGRGRGEIGPWVAGDTLTASLRMDRGACVGWQGSGGSALVVMKFVDLAAGDCSCYSVFTPSPPLRER
jgi:hypothetical protein